jgi:MFS family permease
MLHTSSARVPSASNVRRAIGDEPTVPLAALILASALITLDGTATTIALPAIGGEFSSSMARLQWISNAPLLVLAAMLLPSGALADRYGHVRMMRLGLLVFVTARPARVPPRTPRRVLAAAAYLLIEGPRGDGRECAAARSRAGRGDRG